jgi:hypothetical protein
MNRFLRFVPIAIAGVLLTGCGSTPPAGAPTAKGAGASRIDIKHATDPDAASIDLTPKDITVEDLLATKLPEDMKGGLEDYGNERIGEFEKSTFRVSGTLKSVVLKKDGDYYLVMEGKSGKQAVIEVPDPKLAEKSPIVDRIRAARSEIEAKYHPTDKVKEINQPATIEGVGFYGWKSKKGSGGHGSAPRLMPGTGFSVGK